MGLCASGHAQSAYVGNFIGGYPYSPYGGAVDASGNFYFADQLSQTILEVPVGCVSSSCVVTLAGTSSFNYPTGVAVDSSGNVYVADSNDALLKEIPSGCLQDSCVLTLAGGNMYPALYGIAVDSGGNVYFSDTQLGAVYEMTPGCTSDSCITALGFGVNGFSQPTSLAVDGSGNVYVADDGYGMVFEMSPGCTTSSCVTTLGGGFIQPFSVALDAFNNVYVADYYAGLVDVMPPGCASSACVTTVGGGYFGPTGLAVDSNFNVFVSDYLASAVREVIRQGNNFGSVPAKSSTPATATITFTFTTNGVVVGSPAVLTQGATGLDFNDAMSGSCDTNGPGFTYNLGDTCTVNVTFAPQLTGPRYGSVVLNSNSTPASAIATGYLYGAGSGPQIAYAPPAPSTLGGGFSGPAGIGVDAAGNVYVADTSNNAVKEMTPACGSNACASTLASGFSFNSPKNVAVDGGGNVYVADTGNNAVEVISPGCASSSCVVPLGGGFSGPSGVAVDRSGNVYVADGGNSAVKEMPAGCISSSCVTSLGGGFNTPGGVAVDVNGNVYVADSGLQEVLELSPDCLSSSCVTALGGSFQHPQSVTVDANGNVYAADSQSSALTVIPSGCTAASYSASTCKTTMLGGGYTTPSGVAVDGGGNVYIADTGNNAAKELSFAAPPATLTFPTSTTVGVLDSTDGALGFTVENIGNQPLIFTVPGSGFNPSVTSGFLWDSSSSTCMQTPSGGPAYSLGAVGSCTVEIDFEPASPGLNSGSVTLTDNNLNGTNSMQSVNLSGFGLQTQTITFNPIAAQPIFSTYTLTASSDSGLPITYYTSTPSLCTISGGTVTLNAIGYCAVFATQPGNSVYGPAAWVGRNIEVVKTSQTITFPAMTAQPVNTTYTLPAMASSGLPITYTTSTPTICTINGESANLIAPGYCGIYAAQPGNADYSAATSVARNLEVLGTQQTITFPAISPQQAQTTVTLTASASSGLPVTFASTTPALCTVSGNMASLLAPGYCGIEATQAGNSTYAPATAGRNIEIEKASQTITFPAMTPQPVNTTYALPATASSGLPITYATTTPAICTISGGSAILNAVGYCGIQASQPGNSIYNAAASVGRNLKVVSTP